MRLSVKERSRIVETVNRSDPEAAIYLFGSRTDDDARGGDIDLLIISDTLSFSDKLDIKLELYKYLGEQKIDIVIEKNLSNPFTKIAYERGVRL